MDPLSTPCCAVTSVRSGQGSLTLNLLSPVTSAETIPELPTTEVVQQKLDEKVSKIKVKDPPRQRSCGKCSWSAPKVSSPRVALR